MSATDRLGSLYFSVFLISQPHLAARTPASIGLLLRVLHLEFGEVDSRLTKQIASVSCMLILETRMSVSLIFKYSTGFSPALRRCSPDECACRCSSATSKRRRLIQVLGHADVVHADLSGAAAASGAVAPVWLIPN